MATNVFRLSQYARFKQNTSSEKQESQWIYFDNTKENLELNIGEDGNLLLSHGKTILESFVYLNGKDWIRGFCKGESILIVNKLKGENRRFRMKFLPDQDKSGIDICKTCAEHFSKYFPVKVIQTSTDSTQDTDKTKVDTTDKTKVDTTSQVLSGEVTLSTMAKVVTGDLTERLPSLYHNISGATPESTNTFLRLCLTDPSFPAFVGQVETELNKIKAQEKM